MFLWTIANMFFIVTIKVRTSDIWVWYKSIAVEKNGNEVFYSNLEIAILSASLEFWCNRRIFNFKPHSVYLEVGNNPEFGPQWWHSTCRGVLVYRTSSGCLLKLMLLIRFLVRLWLIWIEDKEAPFTQIQWVKKSWQQIFN